MITLIKQNENVRYVDFGLYQMNPVGEILSNQIRQLVDEKYKDSLFYQLSLHVSGHKTPIGAHLAGLEAHFGKEVVHNFINQLLKTRVFQ